MPAPTEPSRNPSDAYAPPQIAQRVEEMAIRKAELGLLQLATLGLLAGAFIAFGAMFYTLVVTGSTLGFGPTRAMGGVAFSLGLVLVVVAGAELFTGNNLIIMAWAERRITTGQVARNWSVVYAANMAGALGSALLAWLAGMLDLGGGAVGETAVAIARAKVELTPQAAFFRGILCNTLVCLAVWLCLAAHSVTDRILAIVFPISAFVALGFEHSVANMYVIPVAMLWGAEGITLAGFFANLVMVTLGNIVGGSGFVALTYWVCYLRGRC